MDEEFWVVGSVLPVPFLSVHFDSDSGFLNRFSSTDSQFQYGIDSGIEESELEFGVHWLWGEGAFCKLQYLAKFSSFGTGCERPEHGGVIYYTLAGANCFARFTKYLRKHFKFQRSRPVSSQFQKIRFKGIISRVETVPYVVKFPKLCKFLKTVKLCNIIS